jgi:serine/threonine protein kinase
MEMLKSEYELLLGLEGLNINLIHIYGIENKKLDKTTFVVYVLMELAICDWEKEIANREKKKRYYSEEELIIILKNLIYTFAELQRHNISHRDIKPQNILLCKDNSLKIADFGEAKEARNRNNIDTIRQTIRGTELYMSPILFDSLKTKKRNGKYILHNSYKSDVFSLGFCILLAATLKVDSLYVIREIKDMNLLQKEVYNFLKKRYSDKLINIIIAMLEIEEKNRVDFIELEKIVENL